MVKSLTQKGWSLSRIKLLTSLLFGAIVFSIAAFSQDANSYKHSVSITGYKFKVRENFRGVIYRGFGPGIEFRTRINQNLLGIAIINSFYSKTDEFCKHCYDAGTGHDEINEHEASAGIAFDVNRRRWTNWVHFNLALEAGFWRSNFEGSFSNVALVPEARLFEGFSEQVFIQLRPAAWIKVYRSLDLSLQFAFRGGMGKTKTDVRDQITQKRYMIEARTSMFSQYPLILGLNLRFPSS
jgi:hypothetical protein